MHIKCGDAVPRWSRVYYSWDGKLKPGEAEMLGRVIGRLRLF